MDPIIKEMKLKEQKDIQTRCAIGIVVGLILTPVIIGLFLMAIAGVGWYQAGKRIKKLEAGEEV